MVCSGQDAGSQFVSGSVNSRLPGFDDYGKTFLSFVKHILAPLLQIFGLLMYAVRDLMSLSAYLGYRAIHGFVCLLAQILAFPPDLLPCFLP